MKTLFDRSRMLRKQVLSCCVAGMFAGVSIPASAAFFQLAENNASGIGNAFAGGAAIAEDASTVWYNPAGLTRLSGSQFVAGGHFIDMSAKFSKTSATRSSTLGGGQISGGEGGDAGKPAWVPNLYYSQQINERMTWGLGLNAPFGLATNYEDDWVGRYHADHSEIKTINLNAALGYKINNVFSVGGGINYQRLDATLTQAVDYGSLCALGGGPFAACAAPGANDGKADVEADDDTWGFNFGLLWQPLDTTEVGLAYRSKMKYELTGTSDVTAPSALAATAGAAVARITDSDVQANVVLPATLSISTFHQLTSQWALMGDITRTFWHELPELRIDFSSTQDDSVTTLNLKDVNRYSFGATFAPGGEWSYRAGIALDKSPTQDEATRTPRLPDADRIWLALGANYRPRQNFNLDLGFVHIRIDDAGINKDAGTGPSNENFLRGNLVGNYNGTHVNILSAQAKWSF